VSDVAILGCVTALRRDVPKMSSVRLVSVILHSSSFLATSSVSHATAHLCAPVVTSGEFELSYGGVAFLWNPRQRGRGLFCEIQPSNPVGHSSFVVCSCVFICLSQACRFNPNARTYLRVLYLNFVHIVHVLATLDVFSFFQDVKRNSDTRNQSGAVGSGAPSRSPDIY